MQGTEEGKIGLERQTESESDGSKLERSMGRSIGGGQEGNGEGDGFCLRPIDTGSNLLVPSTVQYEKCYDSGSELPEINYELRNTVQKLRSPETKLKSWTSEWMVRRIQDQPPSIAMQDLKTFIRRDREEEITEEMIRELNKLTEDQTLWYIQNLRTKPRQVQTTGKNQMDVTGVVKTMDTLESFPMKALIDLGCTGSCINEEFVKKHQINLTPLPKPIPVFNADGSQNIGGKITHLAQLKIDIGGHEEVMDLGVSNLGKSDIFLGHDWLRYHNPDIDWKKRIIDALGPVIKRK